MGSRGRRDGVPGLLRRSSKDQRVGGTSDDGIQETVNQSGSNTSYKEEEEEEEPATEPQRFFFNMM